MFFPMPSGLSRGYAANFELPDFPMRGFLGFLRQRQSVSIATSPWLPPTAVARNPKKSAVCHVLGFGKLQCFMNEDVPQLRWRQRPGNQSPPGRYLKMSSPILAVFACLLAGFDRASGQGSLTPPGPPAPTMKTLDQIEPRIPIGSLPYTIEESGSYYVTGNLRFEGTNTACGICIQASDVTLDLGGFVLDGDREGEEAIMATNTLANITVRNGTLRNWILTGVDLPSNRSHLTDLTVIGVGGDSSGFYCGDNAVLTRCVSRNHIQTGFYAGQNCMLETCPAIESGYSGAFIVGNGTLVKDCIAAANPWTGFLGGDQCEIRGCLSVRNAFYGVEVGRASKVVDCLIASNSYDGIYVMSGSLVKGCHITDNGTGGIFAIDGSRILMNELRRNLRFDINGLGEITIYGNNSLVEGNHVVVGVGVGILVQGGYTNETSRAQFTNNVIVKNVVFGGGANSYVYTIGNDVGPTCTAATI